MKLSACWIVKNESAVLARSIKSLQDAVDEMVVVDTGSSDDTVEIAKELGARVEHFEWIKDFAAARNFAISKTTGEIVIFLDADEWFVPALTAQDRETIFEYFNKIATLNALSVMLTNIDTKTQIKQDQLGVIRIFKKDPHVYYKGAIHEILIDDRTPSLFSHECSFSLHHSGYSAEIMPQKMARNIELLEKELENPAISEEEKIKTKAYLMREYRLDYRRENEFETMKWLMANPRTMRTLATYPVLATNYCYAALSTGALNRHRVSRKQIYNSIVVKMQKELPKDPSTDIISLAYDQELNLQEDRFIQEVAIEAPFGRWQNAEIGDDNFWKRLAVIYIEAAKAYWRRDNRPKTLEYLSMGFILATDYLNTDALRILLICLRGQPEADQIMLLDRLFGTSNQAKMNWLVEVLREEKSPTLYLYFFKKQMENGWAQKADYYYVKLLLGQNEELLELLEESVQDTDGETALDILSMVAVCADDRTLLEKYKSRMEPHKAMLEAYFDGTALAEPTVAERIKLLVYYPIFAAINEEAAEKFRAVFVNAAYDSFNARLHFCIRNERYAEGLEENFDFVKTELQSVNLYLYCAVRSGNFERLFTCAEEALQLGVLDGETLADILVGAEKAEGELGVSLRQLYDKIYQPYWEHIDMLDVVHTGYLEETQSKKELKQLSTLTFAQFEKELQQEGERFSIPLFNQTIVAAAKIYEERKLWLNAYHCYRSYLLVSEEALNPWQGLQRVFDKVGNKNMSKKCGEIAQGIQRKDVFVADFADEIKKQTTEEIFEYIKEGYLALDDKEKRGIEAELENAKQQGTLKETKQEFSLLGKRAQWLADHADTLGQLYEKMGDEASKATFKAILSNWYYWDMKKLNSAKELLYSRHFNKGVYRCTNQEVVADAICGMGLTYWEYQALYGQEYFAQYNCFEGNPAEFSALENSLKEVPKVTRHEKMLAGSSEPLFLNKDAQPGEDSFAKTGEAENQVETVTLDDAVKEDVSCLLCKEEALAFGVLAGGKNQIQKNKPVLVVALKSGLMGLPKAIEAIEEVCAGYTFYIRLYDSVRQPNLLFLYALKK